MATAVPPRHSDVVVLYNAKVATMDDSSALCEAVAYSTSTHLILTVGSTRELLQHYGPGDGDCNGPSSAVLIDVEGRTILPGLIDSHLHFIREGNHFLLELRWDGVRSLRTALDMLRQQAQRTPEGQWVRVVGGWCEEQFEEKRLPTLEELDEAGQGRPVFVLHLYDCALVNAAGMKLLGYNAQTPNPPSGELVRHADGTPTGVLIARPNAFLLYSTLDKLPKLSDEDKRNSTIAYGRELNRFGVTSCLDPGGGFQAYPNDYHIIKALDADQQLTVRLSYSLFPQRPKKELEDFQKWATMVTPGDGSPFLRHLGAGEMLAFSAADFEDFKEPRPDLPQEMEGDLEPIVRFLVSKKWPFRLHATYGESIERELAIFERIEKEQPGILSSLRWIIDHAETISVRDIARIHNLRGSIAIQHRMAFQGHYFVQRYGKEEAAHSPPMAAMRKAGVRVGAGTDGTRVATYNPWVCLQWLVTGQTVGGLTLSAPNVSDCDVDSNCSSRMDALRWWTRDNAWLCYEEQHRGRLTPGMYADLSVLNQDYFTVNENTIGQTEAELTIVGGKAVYVDPSCTSRYQALSLPPPYSIDSLSVPWSPVRFFGGYQLPTSTAWPVQKADGHHLPRPLAKLLGMQQVTPAQTAAGPDLGAVFAYGHDC